MGLSEKEILENNLKKQVERFNANIDLMNQADGIVKIDYEAYIDNNVYLSMIQKDIAYRALEEFKNYYSGEELLNRLIKFMYFMVKTNINKGESERVSEEYTEYKFFENILATSLDDQEYFFMLSLLAFSKDFYMSDYLNALVTLDINTDQVKEKVQICLGKIYAKLNELGSDNSSYISRKRVDLKLKELRLKLAII